MVHTVNEEPSALRAGYRKKSEKWWSVYRQIVRDAFHRIPDKYSYHSGAADATNAAFEALGIDPYEHEARSDRA